MTCQHAICCATKSGRVWIYGALYFCSCLIEFHCCSNLASSKSSEVPVAPQSCGSPRAQRRAMAGLAWKPKHLWRSTEKSLSEVSAQAFDKWGKLVQGSILHLLCKFSPMPWSMSSHAKLCLRGKLGPKARFSSADESPQHHLVLLDQQKEKTNRVSTLPGKGLRIPRSLVFAPSELLLLVSFLFFLFPILCPQFSIILLDWTNYCILFSITFCSAYRSIYLKKQDPGDWTNPTPWFYLECDQNLAAWLLAIGAICRSNEVDQVSTGNQTLEYNKTSGIQNISKTHPFRYTVT